LSDAHLNDLEKIKAMAEDVGIEADDRTTDNIALVLDNIKKHQQRIVQAISQFDGDLKRAAERDQTAASSSLASEEEDKHASTTPEQAVSSLNQVKSDIKDLTSELSQNGRVSNKQIKKLTERLNKKIEQAKNAMEAGDLNKFNGLLRATEALTNNGLHFLRENQPQEKQIEIEYKENTGGKIKAQFTPAELLQKQEEQRKKFEEQRKEDEEKIYRQNQFDLNTGTTSRQISSSSLNLQTEQRRDGTDQIASTSAEHED
jgi:hypothetical protein